jgi:hypothetical protein
LFSGQLSTPANFITRVPKGINSVGAGVYLVV